MAIEAEQRPAQRRHSRVHRKRLFRERLRPVRLRAKHERRRARLKRRRRWWARPWWQRFPLQLHLLERHLQAEYPGFERWTVGGALLYGGTVELDTLRRRQRIVCIFSGPPSRITPLVMADGPTESRHRFRWSRPTSLCLWYGRDPPEFRWNLMDGLIGLIDLARLHLIKEAWWRATGQWAGLEWHPLPGPDENHQIPSRKSARQRKLQLRQRCWCGRARYSACHKTVSEDDELMALRQRQISKPLEAESR
jgi:hypothetical protein